jgi:hypothetical protein
VFPCGEGDLHIRGVHADTAARDANRERFASAREIIRQPFQVGKYGPIACRAGPLPSEPGEG